MPNGSRPSIIVSFIGRHHENVFGPGGDDNAAACPTFLADDAAQFTPVDPHISQGTGRCEFYNGSG
jgi:hypothetical protein